MTRWLLRLLPIGAVLTVAAFVLASWLVIDRAERNSDQLRQTRAVIRLLCDRGYVLEGMLVEQAAAVRRLRPVDVQMVARLEAYRSQLVEQLTDPDSPCAP